MNEVLHNPPNLSGFGYRVSLATLLACMFLFRGSQLEEVAAMPAATRLLFLVDTTSDISTALDASIQHLPCTPDLYELAAIVGIRYIMCRTGTVGGGPSSKWGADN